MHKRGYADYEDYPACKEDKRVGYSNVARVVNA